MNISSGKFLILFLTSFSFACDNVDYILPPVLTHLKFTTKNVIHEISTTNNQVVLNSTKNGNLRQCAQFSICILNGNTTHTIIQAPPTREFITVRRFLPHSSGKLIDCISLRDDTQWIGGPQHRYQHWPIQNMYYEEEPYVPTHPTNMAITERYWLSSRGVSLHVYDWVPLFIDQNNYKDKYLCFIAQNKAPYTNFNSSLTTLYDIGWYNNSRVAHQAAVERHLGKPLGHPDERMIRHPIWSTWARYKANISETIVNKFADEIVASKFNNSQLEIDDNWETCYGSAIFNLAKFPNVTRLTQNLKRKGFRVTLWIHPFINEGCEPAYSTAMKAGYFVKNDKGQVHTTWWQGEKGAGVIDFTNPKAVIWWVGRLKALQKLGIDSFKFDAGEISFLPQVPRLNTTHPIELQPGIFTKSYVNTLAKNFGDVIEARVGWGTQDLPIFIRMIDKDTKWTWNNGLPTLITTLLQMNMAGYVNVLPDMIGGNGYLNGFLNGTFYPPKELFIRWLQANVFMPGLQYSFVPWDYDAETIAICKKYTDLHASITPMILRAMNESIVNGTPVNAPIWWVDPDNQEAHKINDEYLLGELILVAPVIEENAIVRNIYLPKGSWKDGNNNRTYKGPMWLRDYPAPLNVLPYFIKL
ncbi:hypothetical protein PV326_007551 [Microctonus aethiopoides]|nr:hypothetical protein PV326_007551 [Microctonus aethiopoides]